MVKIPTASAYANNEAALTGLVEPNEEKWQLFGFLPLYQPADKTRRDRIPECGPQTDSILADSGQTRLIGRLTLDNGD